MKVKSALAMKSSSREVSRVVPVGSQVGPRIADTVVERNVCDKQSTRCLIAYAEWVYKTMFGLSSVTVASSVEFLGHLVGRFRRDVPDERATCGHRKQERCFKELVDSVRRDGVAE